MSHLFEICSWYRGVNTYQVILESLRFDTHLPKHQQQVQCEVLSQSGAGWWGRSAVFQATRNHYVSSRVIKKRTHVSSVAPSSWILVSSHPHRWKPDCLSCKDRKSTCTFVQGEFAHILTKKLPFLQGQEVDRVAEWSKLTMMVESRMFIAVSFRLGRGHHSTC